MDAASGHGTVKWLTVSTGDAGTRVWRNVVFTYPSSYARAVKAALRSLKA